MQLHTQIPLSKKPEENQIDYTSKVMLLGSCFSENIGKKFEYYQFQHAVNPFGILFHPKAIETFLTRVIKQQNYKEDEFVFHNERYHCLDAHSCLSNTNASVLVNNLNEILQNTHQQLTEASHLVITLGTAWTYHHIAKNTTVANCHKIPQQQFKKSILSVNAITSSLTTTEQLIRQLNTDVQIIYTVSPVRHIKDGFVENMQSKAHLISAIHQITKTLNTHYFPAYEILMDELRDYRFYTPDMLHPNETAIDYIWEKFQYVWLHQNTTQTMKEVAAIQNGLAHRPFNPDTEQHQQFLEKLNYKKEKLIKAFPFMNFCSGTTT